MTRFPTMVLGNGLFNFEHRMGLTINKRALCKRQGI